MMSAKRSLKSDLRNTLLATGGLGLVGIGLLSMAAYQFYEEQQDRQQIVDAAMLSEANVRRQRADLELMHANFPRFDNLRQRNIVGALPKTVAIDQFEALVAQTGVPLRNYTLGGRLKVELPGVSGFQTYVPSRHEMRFEADPLHEQALFHLTASLDRSLGGLHALEGCVITRKSDNQNTNAMANDVSRLSARCTINWFVFAEHGEVAAGPSTMGN